MCEGENENNDTNNDSKCFPTQIKFMNFTCNRSYISHQFYCSQDDLQFKRTNESTTLLLIIWNCGYSVFVAFLLLPLLLLVLLLVRINFVCLLWISRIQFNTLLRTMFLHMCMDGTCKLERQNLKSPPPWQANILTYLNQQNRQAEFHCSQRFQITSTERQTSKIILNSRNKLTTQSQ